MSRAGPGGEAGSGPLLARLALALLGLMLTLPFLQPHHRLPIPTFYQEWWTAVLGLLATLLAGLAAPVQLRLPRIAALPLALIGLILLQLALRRPEDSDPALLAVLLLAWAVLLMLAGRCLQASLAPATIRDGLAAALLAGALLALATGFAQLVAPAGWPELIAPTAALRMTGNLAQANHLASYLWLGVAAAVALAASGRLPDAAAFAAVTLLAAASALIGARSAWLYALAIVAFGACCRAPGSGQRSPLRLALVALGALVATELVAGVAWPAELRGQSASGRLLAEIDAGSTRLGLWRQAIELGFAQPWLGVGWGRFPAAGYELIAGLRGRTSASFAYTPGEHAHNLFLQLWAELGVAALLVAAGLLVAFARRALRRPAAENLLPLAMLAILFLHSQLEYPLWYAFFLGPAAIALTLADPADLGAVEPPRARPMLVGVVLAAAVVLAVLRVDYTRLERAANWPLTRDGTPPADWAATRATLLDLRRRSLFTGHVDLALAGAVALDRERLADKLQVCAQAIRFSPSERVVFKHALLLALAGHPAEARERLQRALGAYPELAATTASQLARLTGDYPELADLARLAADQRSFCSMNACNSGESRPAARAR